MISAQLGSVQRLMDVFVQDSTVTTGAGLANLQISTFSSYYHRSDMTSTSSVTLVSTGSLGSWSSGQFLQINSTFMRGWYQFAVPNGVFAAGNGTSLLMYGHPSMAPLPIRIEVTRTDNQTYVSAQPFNVDSVRQGLLTTSATGIPTVNVSTLYGSNFITSVAGVMTVNVSSIHGSRAVTTAAGIFSVGAVGVSSFDIRVGVSSFGLPVGVSSITVPVGVSSITVPVGVSSIQIAVGVSSISVPVGVSSLTPAVNVSSIYGDGAVTTAAGLFGVGRVGVSSFGISVGVSSFGIAVGVSSMTPAVDVSSITGITITGTGTSSDPWGP